MIVRYKDHSGEEVIDCTYIDIKRFRILIAWSETVWTSEGKDRKVPFWISRKGLFAGRLAIRMGMRKEASKQ